MLCRTTRPPGPLHRAPPHSLCSASRQARRGRLSPSSDAQPFLHLQETAQAQLGRCWSYGQDQPGPSPTGGGSWPLAPAAPAFGASPPLRIKAAPAAAAGFSDTPAAPAAAPAFDPAQPPCRPTAANEGGTQSLRSVASHFPAHTAAQTQTKLPARAHVVSRGLPGPSVRCGTHST